MSKHHYPIYYLRVEFLFKKKVWVVNLSAAYKGDQVLDMDQFKRNCCKMAKLKLDANISDIKIEKIKQIGSTAY